MSQFSIFEPENVIFTQLWVVGWSVATKKPIQPLGPGVSSFIYRVMALYWLSETCYFDFFVVFPHPFSYSITLFRMTSHFFRITSSFWYYFHTFSVLPHPFGIIFALFVVSLHLFGIIPTRLAVLHHPFAITSYVTNSANFPFIALLLTAANPELLYTRSNLKCSVLDI